MQPVNLFFVTRSDDWSVMRDLELAFSQRKEENAMREHEWLGMKQLVEEIVKNAKEDYLELLDSFYLGYQIPHVGKEFDLLRIAKDGVINIELKSRVDHPKKISNQLMKNQYYLENLSRPILLFTYLTSENRLFQWIDQELREVSFSCLFSALRSQLVLDYENLNTLFSPNSFLISPINTPEKFLNKEYFLTSHQQYIKKCIKEHVKDNMKKMTLVSIKGKPGTGKSLLLYDIALSFAKKEASALFHCSNLPKGLEHLSQRLEKSIYRLHIYSIDQLEELLYGKSCSYIFIDEAHRMSFSQYKLLMKKAKKKKLHLFLSLDPNQIMSRQEKVTDITGRVEGKKITQSFSLTNNIRFNTEIASFIKNLMDLSAKYHYNIFSFPNVHILYAEDKKQVGKYLDFLKKDGYIFIHYKPKDKKTSLDDFQGDYDVYEVVGQEFEKVVVVMNEIFYYKDGLLTSKDSKDFLYTRMLYQAVTRTRSKLSFIIWNNLPLLKQLLMIANQTFPLE